MGRPWVVWRTSALKKGLGIQAEQPIPETKTKSSMVMPSSSMARRMAWAAIPFPQPGQLVVEVTEGRINRWRGGRLAHFRTSRIFFQNGLRVLDLPDHPRRQEGNIGMAVGGLRLDVRIHLPQVVLQDDHLLRLPGHLFDLFPGKGPGGDQPERPHGEPLFPGPRSRHGRGPGHRPVGNQDDLRPLVVAFPL